MNIKEFLKNHILFLDGGMGTLLQQRGLAPGELPERWNIDHAQDIIDIHRSYFDAGSHIVNTNTFGANTLKFSYDELDTIISAAVANAKKAAIQSDSKQPKWIALDIGPTGHMLKPYGDLDFEDAVSIFAETVRLGVKYDVDLIFIETMNDSYETKAALLAAKENSDLPVFVSNAYGADGKLMTGATPEAMVAMLEGMGADAIGLNCSLGPQALSEVAHEYLRCASVPVLFKPNAGLPKVINGCTVYDVDPLEFSKEVSKMIMYGVRIAGGCCGTTPAYISALVESSKNISTKPISEKEISCVSSYTHAVTFGKYPVLIGERINPTGKKFFKEALRAGNMDYILKEGIAQQEAGAHILDVNVGLPEIDEVALLAKTVYELQAVSSLPMQIDTTNPKAMEQALRRYNGKAMINSVNGKQESMDTVFPLAKKYGGLVVALTLDESGIPSMAEERVEIAMRILGEAQKYGLGKKDLIFDPLAMTVSADPDAAKETLRAVKMLHDMGYHTSLGVSNVSFGLPAREVINGTFFTLCLGRGLSAAIMNPYSDDMMKAYHAFLALYGLDDHFQKYMDFVKELPQQTISLPQKLAEKEVSDGTAGLQRAIIKGLKDDAASLCASSLQNGVLPLEIVQEQIIPALNTVGEGFENKTVYLPQLLMSAEAAKSAFEVIKASSMRQSRASKCAIVIATVKGDIHDIGKNIVKLILENYGFDVVDLGRDVEPQQILAETLRLHAPIVGLSALMTTTVPAMEETIQLLHKEAPWCKIMVGGAVLTQEYADMIGADHYAADAMEAVRFAERIFELISRRAD